MFRCSLSGNKQKEKGKEDGLENKLFWAGLYIRVTVRPVIICFLSLNWVELLKDGHFY